MTLPPEIITEWLSRDLATYEEVKDFTRKEVLADIKELKPRPKFYGEKHWLHQLCCFVIGVYNPEFLYFLDMGMGKSRIVLDLFAYYILIGKVNKGLVVVPNITNIDSWIDEAKLFQPHLKIIPLYGSSEERFAVLDEEVDADVFVINSAGLVRMFAIPDLIPKKRKTAKKLMVDQKLVKKYSKMFQAFACDESELIKNIHSLIYQICLLFSSHCILRFGLTGTPMNKEPEDFWAQFYLVNRGETLGETLTLFRAMFYKTRKGYWTRYIYKFMKRRKKDFYRIIQNKSLTYKIGDALDMPPKVYMKRKVNLTPEALVYYGKVVDQVINAKKDYTLMKNSYNRMRQISSGYVTFKNEDTGKKQFIEFKENPKLDELINVINTIPKGRKIIIVHHYIKTGRIISKRLKKEKWKHLRLWSGQKRKKEVIRKFRYQDEHDTLVMNYQSGGRGLNLQASNYVIFFESPDSASARVQCEARIWRGGQKRKCFIIDMITKKTKDLAILASNRSGRNLLMDLINGKEKWK